MNSSETILITGGAGFIGSNLCSYAIQKGYSVICLDNLLTGKKSNLTEIINHPKFSFVEGDIRDFDTCLEVSKSVSAISHQAALGSVPRSIESPIPTNEINCQGFLNMITAARDNGVKRFVYASSSSVYGDSKLSPKREEDLGKPMSPYAVSKLTNELYCKVFFDLYGIETIGLRYFNVFGKNQDPNGAYAAAIPKFIDICKSGNSPTIYGDGSQTRDFTYIKNVLHINGLALNTKNSKSFGESYNVACGNSYSLLEVVAAIRSELSLVGFDQMNEQINFENVRKGDILNSLADISKAKNDLNYEVQMDFYQGIREYIQTCHAKL
ncbi:MAG: NAD-dependent epimerase/dehydratase family protein [Crocinitomicaceae bacterium]|nr:NAD-dependent epimerase/dehydratase family protein [Crocinitomicaceae bacterium]